MEQVRRYCLKVRVFTKRTTAAIRIKAMPKKQVLRKQSQNRTLARVRNLAKSRIASRVPQTVPPVVPPEGPEGPEGPEVPPVVPEGTPEFLGDVFGDVTGPEHTQVNTTRLRNPGFWGSTDLAKK